MSTQDAAMVAPANELAQHATNIAAETTKAQAVDDAHPSTFRLPFPNLLSERKEDV
jgi:hypothetical protein